ncbi:unnamed protein product [Phaedon cochleariae]|uniref:Envelope protein n=1 Tax=Phaedon cochleariae TaxID=80249 RepID=A0A9P0GMV4_PHACE|nr:unnamed protein product [Phaedon cochleariae]
MNAEDISQSTIMKGKINCLISSWILLSSITRGSSGENYSITKITSSSGLYYEKIGDVLLSNNNNWEFVTSVDYKGYLMFYEYLHTQAQKLDVLCQESYHCDERFRSIKSGLNRIDEIDESIANFLGIRTENRRVKRFWEAIGNFYSEVGEGVARTIFGGGNNQPNLAIYNNQIAGLYSSQKDIENKLNQQTTLFLVYAERKNHQIQWLTKTQNEIQSKIRSLESDFRKDAVEKEQTIKELQNMLDETNNKLKEQEEKQKKVEGDVEGIKNKILEIDEQIKTINEDVSKNTENIDQSELEMNIYNLFTDFEFLIIQFQTEQAKVYDVIKYANEGSLDPYVLTPLNLIEMLQEIQGHLSEGHQFPFYPSIENARHLYNIMKIEVYLYNTRIIFTMNIPLVNNKKFGIHKITSLPLPYAPERFVFILPQEPFLIVDDSYHEYLLMSYENFRAYCEEMVDERYLCKQVDQLSRSDSDDDCEMKLFSTALLIPHSCNKRAIEIKQSIFLQLQKSRSWIYAAKTNESVIISCAATRQTIGLQGSGFISLSEDCTARTSENSTLEYLYEFRKPVLSNYSGAINLMDFVDSSEIGDLLVKEIKLVKNIISPFDSETLKKISFPIVDTFRILKRNIIIAYLLLAIIVFVTKVACIINKKDIDVERWETILYNEVRFSKNEPNDDDQVRVELYNQEEKSIKKSENEDPSSNTLDVENSTSRFKIQKQHYGESSLTNQIKNEKYFEENNGAKPEYAYIKELKRKVKVLRK